MNNPFEFVIAILAMVFIFSLMKHRMRVRDEGGRTPADDAETLRLREEVADLKERLKVLERITVEKENSLSREIESLRDR